MSHLSFIRLKNFRNLENQELELNNYLNIFIGPNGTGKTNILESISLFSVGRGFKKQSLDRMTNLKKNYPWIIYSKYIKKNLDFDISITYEKKENGIISKKLLIDGKKKEKKSYSNSKLSIIWFIPEMERLFIGPPSLRRNFIDRITYSFDQSILNSLNTYMKLLRERFNIIKRPNSNSNWLSKIENKIANLGIEIIFKRLNTIRLLNETFKAISTDEMIINQCKIILKSGINKRILEHENQLSFEGYIKELENSRDEDSIKGGCKIGPHKSDIGVQLNEDQMDATFCSTAQQK